MNNVETNALKIAELMGYERTNDGIYVIYDRFTCSQYKLIKGFSSYDELMSIVFKCQKTTHYAIKILDTKVLFGEYDFMNEFNVISGKNYTTESELVEAIQEACIKYLELKNGK